LAVIFVLSPILGALTDQAPRRMPFLIVSTLVCVAMTMMIGSGSMVASLIYFGIANVAYNAGLQFYDALLPEVSTETTRGRISGIGVGVGYIGAFIGIGLGMWLLGTGIDDLPAAEQSLRYQRVFVVTGVLFLVFAIPCFLFVPERGRPNRRMSMAAISGAMTQVAATFRNTGRYPGLARFLIGRAFYADAINTVIVFMALYASDEVGMGTDRAQILLAVAIAFAVVGGLVWGRIVDRIGPKRTLTRVLQLWVLTFTWTAVVGFLPLPAWTFWPVPILAGVALGGTWTADRPYMLRLTPPARVGEFYGLYGMVGRFSAIIGPLTWSLVADVLGLGRPAAVTVLLGMIIASYIILAPVSDAPREWSDQERMPA
jgi:UMF1 family MFS transporter